MGNSESNPSKFFETNKVFPVIVFFIVISAAYKLLTRELVGLVYFLLLVNLIAFLITYLKGFFKERGFLLGFKRGTIGWIALTLIVFIFNSYLHSIRGTFTFDVNFIAFLVLAYSLPIWLLAFSSYLESKPEKKFSEFIAVALFMFALLYFVLSFWVSIIVILIGD